MNIWKGIFMKLGMSMEVKTTICIGHENRVKIEEAAVKAGISIGQMISTLFKYAYEKTGRPAGEFGPVRYRRRGGRANWQRLPVEFRFDEYEFCIDLRKVWKMSVSFIADDSIERYLDELMCKMLTCPDNYRYSNYVIETFVYYGVQCWIMYWGIPPKLLSNCA